MKDQKAQLLSNLKEVVLRYSDYGLLPTEPITDILRLPRLERLELVDCCSYEDEDFGTERWDCPVGASNVRHLKFRNCSLHGSHIRTIGLSCAELRSFEWSYLGGADYQFDIKWIDFHETIKAHEKTLQKLTLDVEGCEVFDERPDGVFLGSLKTFKNLREIEISVSAFLQDEEDSSARNPGLFDLPSSLESLTLFGRAATKSLLPQLNARPIMQQASVGTKRIDETTLAALPLKIGMASHCYMAGYT